MFHKKGLFKQNMADFLSAKLPFGGKKVKTTRMGC